MTFKGDAKDEWRSDFAGGRVWWDYYGLLEDVPRVWLNRDGTFWFQPKKEILTFEKLGDAVHAAVEAARGMEKSK